MIAKGYPSHKSTLRERKQFYDTNLEEFGVIGINDLVIAGLNCVLNRQA